MITIVLLLLAKILLMTWFRQNFLLLSGLTIGGILLFWRFLRIRPQGPIELEFSYIRIGLYLFSILVLLFTLYSLLIGFNSKSSSKLAIKVAEYKAKLVMLYERFTEEFLDKIIYKYPIFVSFIRISYHKWFYLHKFFPYIVHFLIFIPPVLLAASFFYDVVIAKSFHYFPRMIIVMLLPLLVRLIAWLTYVRCDNQIKGADTNITFSVFPDGQPNIYIGPEVWAKNKKLAEILSANLNEVLEQYLKNLEYLPYAENFYTLLNSPSKKFYQIFSILLWIASWSTLIYYLIVLKA